jgi:hypothetical protein
MKPENKELPRLLLASDTRRLNHELLDLESDVAGFENLEHEGVTPF